MLKLKEITKERNFFLKIGLIMLEVLDPTKPTKESCLRLLSNFNILFATNVDFEK